MKRLLLVAVAALAICAPSAKADPADAANFGIFNLQLQSLRATGTAAQQAAVDSAMALYTASKATKVSDELKLVSAMLKKLDKPFAGNTTYQSAADQFVVTFYVLKVGPLANQANLAAGLHFNIGAIKTVAAKLKALDLDKNKQPAEITDYQVNRAKFRAKALAMANYCQGIIKKYGG